jgi:hypothetical protein
LTTPLPEGRDLFLLLINNLDCFIDFIMHINSVLEAFDNPYSFSSIDRHKNEVGLPESSFSSSFKTSDGTNVIVYFDPDIERGAWDIHFERETAKGGYSENITDQGDAFKIYATVLKIIKQFIEKKSPTKINFSARKIEYSGEGRNTKSRAKLYDRMVNKFSSQMGYKLKRKIDNKGLSVYILERMINK